MQIAALYSHLNGEEYLIVHRPALWKEVKSVIARVDAEACRTKVSGEKSRKKRTLYSPTELNRAFKKYFERRGWRERRRTFWITSDERLMRDIHELGDKEQKIAIEGAGVEPIMSYNQTDFLKERVAVEVQFGHYTFVAHDLFVKHPSF